MNTRAFKPRSSVAARKAQLRRGVISPLIGQNSRARSTLAADLHGARQKPYLYGFAGDHYVKVVFSDDPTLNRALRYAAKQGVNAARDVYYNWHSLTPREPNLYFNAFRAALQRAESEKKRVRWLDVGAGLPRNFMPVFEFFDPDNRLVELHTLSPDQILPEKISTEKRTGIVSLSGGRQMKAREMIPNPDYGRWKDRLNHHPGAIETYDPTKLGKFDFIISITGGTFYVKHPLQVVAKTAKLLAPQGTAVLHTLSQCTKEKLAKKLGKSFKVKEETPGEFTIFRTK